MKSSVARVLSVFTLISRLKNRLLNQLACWATGQKLSVDWSAITIVHPESIHIGNRFYAGRGLRLESVDGQGQLHIGDDVAFSEYVHIGCSNKVQLGNGVLLGSKVLITDHAHGVFQQDGPVGLNVNPGDRPINSKGPVIIGDRAWLGDGVCVLPNVRIGEGAIVGANAVVLTDIPAGTVWAGVPAKQVWPKLTDRLMREQ